MKDYWQLLAAEIALYVLVVVGFGLGLGPWYAVAFGVPTAALLAWELPRRYRREVAARETRERLVRSWYDQERRAQ